MPPMATQTIRIGHSPDPDDAFMFYAMTQGKIPSPGFQIEHVLEDIETLNERARRGELDVTAFSLHAYAYCAAHYKILASGASMGDGYGPIVVTRHKGQSPWAVPGLRPGTGNEESSQGTVPDGATVAIPGRLTTAAMTLRLWAGPVKTIILPFDQILDAVRQGRVAAGILIHEGQLTYAGEGLHKVVDLGEWWMETSGLPLPLGVNGVRRDLPNAQQLELAQLMRRSIAYALAHRSEALAYAQLYGRGLDLPRTDQFVGMYVNHWTEECGRHGREAMTALLARAAEVGIIPAPCVPEFVEDGVALA
ncbi:MAG: ABC transporter substrate-binding protein [Candidatus Omnitrophica bacterium]|nr:ABC transporter substrate-binding protein [Candidatus Omnitrophota bacterium]